MVKRQKEKQYQSAIEHRVNSQIRSGRYGDGGGGGAKRLPFNHCALTLTPFQHPVCNRDGIVFENSAILPFLLEHKIDPVTGASMTHRDLITLNMSKEEDDDGGTAKNQYGLQKWQCPVLNKALSDHIKIVAILQPKNGSGDKGNQQANVYSFEAYQELNIKAKNYEDLISGATFHPKSDVIVLNDPNNDEFNNRRDINQFYHITHSRELKKSNAGGITSSVKHSVTASRILGKLENDRKKAQLQQQKEKEQASNKRKRDNDDKTGEPNSFKKRFNFKVLASDVTGVEYTTGESATSLTSTAVVADSSCAAREATEDEILQAQCLAMRKKRKRKGLVRMCTTAGNLTLELDCDIVPRTCINFLALCRTGAYKDSKFHRLVPNFMIQGGSSATTSGGNGNANSSSNGDTSIWGGAFADEFDDRLKHSGCGVLSMANAGPNTNRRQFFITFKSCPHLDRKHSVFGHVIKGLDTLKEMERVPIDKKNRPKDEIKIISTNVLIDPAKEAEDSEYQRLQKLAQAREKKTRGLEKGNIKSSESSRKKNPPTTDEPPQVGRYLKDKLKAAKSAKSWQEKDKSEAGTTAGTIRSRLPPPPKKTTFGDFSGW